MKNTYRKLSVGSALTSVAVLAPVLIEKGLSFNWVLATVLLSGLLQWLLLTRLYRSVAKRLEPLAAGLQRTSFISDPAKTSRQADVLTRLTDATRRVEADIREATDFAVRIGEGQLEAPVHQASHRNPLWTALEETRGKLQSIADQERQQRWHVDGLAKFNELLRQPFDDPRAFGAQLMKHLVNYLPCNQGGLYISGSEDDKPYLELVGCYAFERTKHHQQRIQAGEGLLGQCLREKDTLYLTDIPADYIRITSGLGGAVPRCILIVPLKANQEMYGALELASLQNLAHYQIAFVEALSASIAASLANIRNNQEMRALLEQSQYFNDQMSAQEEFMKQSLLTLKETQHKMLTKQVELNGLFFSIDAMLAKLDLSPEGDLLAANEPLLRLTGYQQAQIHRQPYQFLFENPYQDIRERLMEKQSVSGDFSVLTKEGIRRWLHAAFTPALDIHGQVYKIIMLALDVTDQLEYRRLSMVADHTNNSVIITDPEGKIEFVNRGFTEMTGYTLPECEGKKPGSFLQGADTNPQTIEGIRQAIRARKPIYEEVLNYHKTGEPYWISLAINPVFNESGELDKFISIQTDITQTKFSALDYHYKLNAISESNAVAEFDLNGYIAEANANFLGIFGYTQAELVGKHHRLLLARAEQEETLWERLCRGESVRDEFRRFNQSGEEVWLRGAYNPILDLNDKPYKIVMFAVDMTEEKKLGLAAREKETELVEYLKAINLTIASMEFDPQGTILDANSIFLGLTGYQKSELLGSHSSVLLSEAERRKSQHELMWANLKEGKFFEGEFRIRSKAGRELWLKGTYNPIIDLNGHLVKITLLAQFTTDEKEKEVELSGTVNALRNLDAVLELTPDGTFKSANEKFLSLVGFKRMELRNQTLAFFLEQGHQALPADFLAKLSQGETLKIELDWVVANKQFERVQAIFNPVVNLEGKTQKIVAVLR